MVKQIKTGLRKRKGMVMSMMLKATGFLVLIFFYSVYFAKMLQQRKKGIQTDQIAKGGKPADVMRTELLMKIAAYSVVIVEIASIVTSNANVNTMLWIAGTAVCVSGNLIFSLAVYTMRDSWRAGIPRNDKTELVTSGIYSVSRNPAFLGFDLVYIGILILFFNWIHLAFVIFAIMMLHLQILKEEKFLPAVFGEDYIQYKERVGRYIGRVYK